MDIFLQLFRGGFKDIFFTIIKAVLTQDFKDRSTFDLNASKIAVKIFRTHGKFKKIILCNNKE